RVYLPVLAYDYPSRSPPDIIAPSFGELWHGLLGRGEPEPRNSAIPLRTISNSEPDVPSKAHCVSCGILLPTSRQSSQCERCEMTTNVFHPDARRYSAGAAMS